MTERKDHNATELSQIEHANNVPQHDGNLKTTVGNAIQQDHAEFFLEAIQAYPNDDAISPEQGKRVKRKLDWRILPCLGICYFFYYVDKTTLSYAAIYGIRESLNLHGSDYSLLSSCFYIGWLIWAIPSNLIMQRCPPAWYLSFNILMWGVLLMCQAASQNLGGLFALRVLSGAFEAIADPAFMVIISTYYTREEQPARIAAYYLWNGIGIAGGGLIGYGIGHIKGALESWRYEFLIVGAVCAFWAILLCLFLPNSPTTFWGFSREERLLMIARVRRNQTGVERRQTSWAQIKEAYCDYKTWLFTLLGFVGSIPNGGISNFSTLVIQGLGFDTFHTSLLGIPQGAIVSIWIILGAVAERYSPKNSRTLIAALFMLPQIAGALGFLLASPDATAGRLICFYLLGSYQASFVVGLSLVTSNTGGQSKKMIVSGMIWFGSCAGSIVSPFFYKSDQAPRYTMGIASLITASILMLLIFVTFRFALIWENKRKERVRQALRESGDVDMLMLNSTAFNDLTDKQNPNFEYVY